MRFISFIFLFLCCFNPVFSQGRLVMNNDGYIVIRNGAYVVIGNSNANAITQTGTGGRIISEAETNRVRWNVSNATGTYVVPFYDDDNAQEIPLTVIIGTGGTAGATNHIDFSTYDGSSFDNATYMPSGVTNMGSATVPAANNSAKVIDRFWIIDANHAAKPSVTLSFTYIDAEWSGPGNSITEGNLAAQRWNTSAGDWDGYIYTPAGIANTATNVVSGVNAPAADFFKSWTLVDLSTPLPIELISNTANCSDSDIVISWSTATETNNSHFTLEKSIDGINFTTLTTVPGAGTSTAVHNYSYTDHNPYNGTSYYRLSQTDYNGDTKVFNVVTAENCNTSSININAFNDGPGSIAILIDTNTPGDYTATLFDALGKKTGIKKFVAAKGNNKFQMGIQDISPGIYFISIANGKDIITKKILVL